MYHERQSRQELISFAKTLVSSGCESIGPQCTYVSDITDEDNSLIPSKSVAEVLEIKYGNHSSYAPALADFLSSHQSFFGTGSSSVMAYTTFLLSEISAVDASQQSVLECCITLESVFTEVCESLSIKHETRLPVPAPDIVYENTLGKEDDEILHLVQSIGLNDILLAEEIIDESDDLDWYFNDTDLSANQPIQEAFNVDNLIGSEVSDEGSFWCKRGENKQISENNSDNSRSSHSVTSKVSDRKEVELSLSKFSLPIFSDAWFAYGLQHCFQWEFEFNLESGINAPHPDYRHPISLEAHLLTVTELDIALPMRLAMIAATALWKQTTDNTNSSLDMRSQEYHNKTSARSDSYSDDLNVNCQNDENNYREDDIEFKRNSGNKKSNFSFETLENSRSFADELRTESEYNYYSFLNELSIDDLIVHTVCGVPSKYSTCIPESLVCSCKKNVVGQSMDIVQNVRDVNTIWADQKYRENGDEMDMGREQKGRDGYNTNVRERKHEYYSLRREKVITFFGVAVVDTGWGTDGFDSGDFGEGAGASLQAHAIRHTFVKSPSLTSSNNNIKFNNSKININTTKTDGSNIDQIYSRELMENNRIESSDSIYLRKSIGILKKLKINVLFCSRSFCSIKLIDACISSGIAVFPLSSQELISLSILINAEIVGDILDLEPDSRGQCVNVQLFPFLSVRASEISRREKVEKSSQKKEKRGMNESEDSDEILIKISRVLHCTNEEEKKSSVINKNNVTCFNSPAIFVSNAGMKNAVLSSASAPSSFLSSRSTSPHSMISNKEISQCPTQSNIASVIISAPTSALTRTLTDRFYRCLHRLRAVVQGAGVMPGAGVPELLVHIQLDYEIEKRIKILRELQRDQEIYEYELRYSVAYHSTHRSEHEEVEMSTKVERDQRVEVGRREKEKKEEDKEGVEEEIRRGGGEERRGSGGGRGSHTGGNHIIYGGRHRTSKIDKTDVEMTDSSNQMKFEKEKELKAENIIRINEIKKHLEIIEILKATQRGLLSYIRAVSMNNGATWVEASDRIKKNEENMKSILQLTFNSSFYDTLHLSSTTSSSSSSSPCASSYPNSEKYAEESVQDSLKFLSSDKICSLSQFAPITIPTDSLIDPIDSAQNDFLNFDEGTEVRKNINEGIEDFPSNSNNFYIRPILDVVGIKINSFKNSVSAIKMFLSARIKVNNI